MPNLVITRREGETIVIGDRITIKVVGYQGQAVKLAIEAPREIKIWRGEVGARVASAVENTPRSG